MKISKIISILLLSFSSLLLLYLFYRSEFYFEGIRFGFYLKYYFIAIIFIILSVISFFIKEKIKIRISLVLFSIAFTFYIVEGGFQIYKVISYDTQTKLQVYENLKKEDPDAVLTVWPFLFINETNQTIFPLSGISNRQTLFCNNDGYYPINQSDRYGFNNPDIEWDKKKI